MQAHVQHLEKRRFIAGIVLCISICLAVLVSINFDIVAPSYFEAKYNMYLVYGLMFYKCIELAILYYVLFYRYILLTDKCSLDTKSIKKLHKHTKLLFFLVPQGSIVFGIIAYKLSENVVFFILFALIGLFTLSLISPCKLCKSSLNSQA